MRVGAIPLLFSEGDLRICVISGSRNSARFTFPKGALKDEETWEKGALRELHEEAGLKGKIIMPKLPLVIKNTREPLQKIILYWVEVEKVAEDWPEKAKRERKFFPIEEVPKEILTDNARKAYKQIIGLNPSKELIPEGFMAKLQKKIGKLQRNSARVTS